MAVLSSQLSALRGVSIPLDGSAGSSCGRLGSPGIRLAVATMSIMPSSSTSYLLERTPNRHQLAVIAYEQPNFLFAGERFVRERAQRIDECPSVGGGPDMHIIRGLST